MKLIRALPYLIVHQFVAIYQSTKSKSATMVLAEPSCYFDKTFCFHRETKSKIQGLSNNFKLYYIFQIIFFMSQFYYLMISRFIYLQQPVQKSTTNSLFHSDSAPPTSQLSDFCCVSKYTKYIFADSHTFLLLTRNK